MQLSCATPGRQKLLGNRPCKLTDEHESTSICPFQCNQFHPHLTTGGPESLGSRRNLADEHVSIFSHMHYRSGVWWMLELAMDLESMQLGVYLHHGSLLEAVMHVVVEVGGRRDCVRVERACSWG